MTSEHVFKCLHPKCKDEYQMTYFIPCLYCDHDRDKHTHRGDKDKMIVSNCDECECFTVWMNADAIRKAQEAL